MSQGDSELTSAAHSARIGVVVIGRNEGERLERCLRSLAGRSELTVYVDSGSDDQSVPFAESMGVEVVHLDLTKPFTMARARNAGFARLVELDSDLAFVQFVDGDCEVQDGWIERARDEFTARADVVAVCGRRRERAPEASVYNRLTDMEWDTPPGEVESSGGDVMIRSVAFVAAGGFNEGMIAGEEPELCVRLRAQGGKILRVDAEMTLHDAAMTRFSQWWKRCVRGGHAYAEGAALHGEPPERHKVRQLRSCLFWGLVTPFVAVISIIAALFWVPSLWIAAALCLVGYPLLYVRIYRRVRRRKNPVDSKVYSLFTLLAKFPQFLGVCSFVWNRLQGKKSTLIEYKQTQSEST